MNYKLLFILLVLPFLSFSQQLKTTISEEYKNEGGFWRSVKTETGYIGYYTIGSTDHLSYGFGWNKVRLGIQVVQYDNNMRVIKRHDLSEGKRVYGPFLTDIKLINKKVYIIYHEVQEPNSIGNIMAVEINQETLEAGKPKVIAEVAHTSYNLEFSEDLQNKFKYYIKTSPDKKKNMLVLNTGNELFFVSVMDENLNIIWNRKDAISEDARFVYQSFLVDNSANVYIAYKACNKELNTANTNSKISIYHQTGSANKLTLNLDACTIQSFGISSSLADNNIINIGGLYTKNPTHRGGQYGDISGSLTGAFNGTLNCSNFSVSKLTQTVFPDSLISQFEKDGWASLHKKSYGLTGALSTQIFDKENGNIDIVGEFSSVDNGIHVSTINTGSILNINFTSSGVFFTRIPKYRSSAESTMGNSYHAFPYKDNIFIFYNDNENNLHKDIIEKPSNSNTYKNLVLIAALIDNKGNVIRQPLIDFRSENYLSITECMVNLASDKLFLPMYKIKGLGGISDMTRLATINILP